MAYLDTTGLNTLWAKLKGYFAPIERAIPSGGSSGQILAKSSGTDYDVGWVNRPTSGGTSFAYGISSDEWALSLVDSRYQILDTVTMPEADSQNAGLMSNDMYAQLQGMPSGGSSGQVLAKASGTDYDTEWVNQSSGGGLAYTDFVLEQYTVINGVSTANNGVAENTVTETKAGYYPLAIAGWTSNNRYPNVYGCRLTAQSVGSASIFCGASNFSGSTRTLTVSAVVLWVKVS